MSHDIRVWEQSTHRPQPKSLEAVVQQMAELEKVTLARQSAPFVAFANKLLEGYPSADMFEPGSPEAREAVWLRSPVKDAEEIRSAVWAFSLNTDDQVRVLRYVVDQATALGLTVFDDQLGIAFLPNGQVLPAEHKKTWAGLKKELDAEEPPITKPLVRKMMGIYLNDILSKHGFTPRKTKVADLEFFRPIDDGFQIVKATVEGASPYFECMVWGICRIEAIQKPLEDIFDKFYYKNTFSINAGAFVGKFNESIPIGSAKEIEALLALVRDNLLPLLNFGNDIKAVDRIFNDNSLVPLAGEPSWPGGPRDLAAHLQEMNLTGLVAAWMAGNPKFDDLVRGLKERNADEWSSRIREKCDVLVAHLRANVPRMQA